MVRPPRTKNSMVKCDDGVSINIYDNGANAAMITATEMTKAVSNLAAIPFRRAISLAAAKTLVAAEFLQQCVGLLDGVVTIVTGNMIAWV